MTKSGNPGTLFHNFVSAVNLKSEWDKVGLYFMNIFGFREPIGE